MQDIGLMKTQLNPFILKVEDEDIRNTLIKKGCEISMRWLLN